MLAGSLWSSIAEIHTAFQDKVVHLLVAGVLGVSCTFLNCSSHTRVHIYEQENFLSKFVNVPLFRSHRSIMSYCALFWKSFSPERPIFSEGDVFGSSQFDIPWLVKHITARESQEYWHRKRKTRDSISQASVTRRTMSTIFGHQILLVWQSWKWQTRTSKPCLSDLCTGSRGWRLTIARFHITKLRRGFPITKSVG